VNDTATLTITAGQVYHVTGYAKSASGNINLRAFLHASSDKNIVYSDRVAETYASASGRTFSLYLTASIGASDATFSLETSNNDISYELDEVSVRRVSANVKNTNTFEVLAYQNSTAMDASISCPG
jgi:hypothetical protein